MQAEPAPSIDAIAAVVSASVMGMRLKMHQLSNLMHWFKLRAMWRIGRKPL
jgi:hypothetical protein